MYKYSLVLFIVFCSASAAGQPEMNEDTLRSMRNNVLYTYFHQPYNKQKLERIIVDPIEDIQVKDIFQAVFNEDSTKFIAFFTTEIQGDRKAFHSKKNDTYVEFIWPKGEKAYSSENLPNTYAYAVVGVFEQNRWYYEKSHITYLEAQTPEDGQWRYFNFVLQSKFFRKNTTEKDPQYWERKSFAKVVDLKVDPAWKDLINDMDPELYQQFKTLDSLYMGMHKITAHVLQRERKLANDAYERIIGTEYLDPLMAKMRPSYQIVDFYLIGHHLLLYPEDKTMIICPITVWNDYKKTYIYIFMLKQDNGTFELYEWTYFKRSNVSVFKQISKISNWKHYLDRLEDRTFWNKYVLAQSKGKYKYLKKID